MLNFNLGAGVIFVYALFNRVCNAAGNGIAAPCARRGKLDGALFKLLGNYFERVEHARKLLERYNEVDIAADIRARSFELFSGARAYEYYAGLGVLLLDVARGRNHGRELLRNFGSEVGELPARKLYPRGAAAREKEGLFARGDRLYVVVRLGNAAHVCAVGDFVNILKAHL